MKQEKIWDEIAESWNERKTEQVGEYGSFLEGFISNKDKKILDLGCGSGRHFFKNNGKIYAVDFSKEMLKYAEENARKKRIDIKTFKANVYDLPFQDDFFDKAIFIATLHCVKSKVKRQKALKELYRVLKPQGKAIITVWNKSSKRWRAKKKEVKASWNTGKNKLDRYYYLYDIDELLKECEKVGFKTETPSKTHSRNIVVFLQKPQ